MRKNGFIIAALISVVLLASCLVSAAADGWEVYNGDVLPSDAVPQWRDVRGNSYIPVVQTNSEAEDGKVLVFNELDKGLRSVWGIKWDDFSATDGVTIAWRAKPVDGVDADVISEVRVHTGYRTIVRVEPTRIRVDGFDSFDFEDTDIDPTDWMTFRAVITGDFLRVYVNEASEPAIAGLLSKKQDGSELWFGEDSEGKRNIAGMIDWIAWNLTGAYAPDELQLPVR